MSNKPGAGRPTLYDEEFHIKLLFEMFEAGKGAAHFCAKSGISDRTFEVWKKKHKNLRKAYEECLSIGESQSWDKLDDPPSNFNVLGWKFKHLNQFVLPKRARAFKTKEKTVEAKMKAAWRALTGGHITPQEYGQLIGAIITESKSKQPENQEPTHDFKGVPDWAIKVFNAVVQGKKVTIED